ncbi:MAG: M20/M25/M40 family metallo-hydrolase [Sphaerochaetaceae bacterium]
MIVLFIILGILLVLFLTCFIVSIRKESRFKKENGRVKTQEFKYSSDEKTEDRMVKNLQNALKFKTIAEDCLQDKSEFEKFHLSLEKCFPLVYKNLKVQEIDGKNLCFEWTGTSPIQKPILLMAHQDVVKAGDLSKWDFSPFDAIIDDKYLYGRGTIDIKSQVIAILESFETLLRKGFKPKNTIFASFSEDEEIFGKGGASLAQYFKDRKIEFKLVLDEGGAVAEDFLKIINKPIAVVGVSEKTTVNLSLEVNQEGGHSSTPKNPTSLGILSHAISNLELNQEKWSIDSPMDDFLLRIGCNTKGFTSLAMLNPWLFKKILFSTMKNNSTTSALFRNTHTVTMCKGSEASNIIPVVSKANVNVRLLPDNSIEDTISWMEKIINDERVKITISQQGEKCPVSNYKCEEFKVVEQTIQDVFGDVLTLPYLLAGGTDSRHFYCVSDKVYRFSPYMVNKSELSRMHNYNERISLENLKRLPSFYIRLIQYFD